MSSLVFLEPKRGPPKLVSRAWRTPDPSPTRDCGAGLPGCRAAVLWYEEPHAETLVLKAMPLELPLELPQDKGEVGTLTPTGHDAALQLPSFRWQGRTQVPWVDMTRTPSRTPSPMGRPPRTELTEGQHKELREAMRQVAAAGAAVNASPHQQAQAAPQQNNDSFFSMRVMAARQAATPQQKSHLYFGMPMETVRPHQVTTMATSVPPPPPPPPFERPPRVAATSRLMVPPPPPPPPPAQAAAGRVTSMGSVGHPFNCAEACKYSSKPKGCKDGSTCVRCHHCDWNRHGKQRVVAKRSLCTGY
mmetsp:Transcript_17208/g.60075  ORF Transcript_17208/g.60075 Transcript_17208/m.60075 type:complete len:303 (-) Transcript_17208:121-1029(-)